MVKKDRIIKIYQLTSRRELDALTKTIKKYIHPIDEGIKAYVRDQSSTEVQRNGQASDEETIYAIINRRNITKDMFVEYHHRGMEGYETYNVVGIDDYNGRDNEIRLTLVKIKQTIDFDEEEGTPWNA